jgi:hypothetical protein
LSVGTSNGFWTFDVLDDEGANVELKTEGEFWAKQEGVAPETISPDELIHEVKKLAVNAGQYTKKEKDLTRLTVADLEQVYHVDFTGESGITDARYVGQSGSDGADYEVLCDLRNSGDDEEEACITHFFVRDDGTQLRGDFSGSPDEMGTMEEMQDRWNAGAT